MSTAIAARASEALSRDPKRRFVFAALAAVISLVALVAAYELRTGAPKNIVMALVIAAAPICLYVSIRRPLIFPFALYAIAVPFSNLVYLGGFGTVTKLIGVLAAAMLTFYVVRTKRVINPPVALFAWLTYIAWVCASIAWAIDPALSLASIGILLSLFLLYVVSTLVPVTPFELRVVLAAIAVGGLCAAAYGAYAFRSGMPTSNNRFYLQSSNTDAAIDPNHFAASLLLPIAIVLMAALSTRNMLLKFGLFVCAGVLMTGVYASASRGAFVAVLAMVVYFVWKSRKRLQIVFLAAAASVSGLFLPTAMWSRILKDPGNGSGRTVIWSVGLDALHRYWLLGAGILNFPNAYDQSYLKIYSPVFQQWSMAAHNILVQTAVELGVVGIGILVWVVASQFRILKDIKPGDELYTVRIGLEAAFIGMLTASMFLDVLFWKYSWLTFMAMALARSAAIDARPVRAESSTALPTLNGNATARHFLTRV